MDREDLTASLVELQPTFTERLHTEQRADLFSRVSAVYHANGVLDGDGFAPMLRRACPAAATCWAGLPEAATPRAELIAGRCESGSIFWPWIGAGYQPGGVCVIGLNLNIGPDWWSIAEEYGIVDSVREHLAAGQRQNSWRSRFAYCSLASAGAVLAWLDGRPLDAEPEPQALLEVLDRTARLQTVKCSPLDPVVHNSQPTAAMKTNCPSRFLAGELRILAPRVILTFGADARRALEHGVEIKWVEREPDYRRGELPLGDGSATLHCLPHPAAYANRWRRGHDALLAHLQTNRAG